MSVERTPDRSSQTLQYTNMKKNATMCQVATEVAEVLSAFGRDHKLSMLLLVDVDNLRSSAHIGLCSTSALLTVSLRKSQTRFSYLPSTRSEGRSRFRTRSSTCAYICARRTLPSGRFLCAPPEPVLRRALLLVFPDLVQDVQCAPT